jgi:hypothetical protein
MAKQLKGALSALLQDPVEKNTVEKKSVEKTEIRSTFIVDKEKLEQLKAIAFNHNILIKDVVDSAFTKYITQYEKKHGKVQPIPDKKEMPI